MIVLSLSSRVRVEFEASTVAAAVSMFPICVSKALPSTSERTTDDAQSSSSPLLQSPNGESGRRRPFVSPSLRPSVRPSLRPGVMEFRARARAVLVRLAGRPPNGRTATAAEGIMSSSQRRTAVAAADGPALSAIPAPQQRNLWWK